MLGGVVLDEVLDLREVVPRLFQLLKQQHHVLPHARPGGHAPIRLLAQDDVGLVGAGAGGVALIRVHLHDDRVGVEAAAGHPRQVLQEVDGGRLRAVVRDDVDRHTRPDQLGTRHYFMIYETTWTGTRTPISCREKALFHDIRDNVDRHTHPDQLGTRHYFMM